MRISRPCFPDVSRAACALAALGLVLVPLRAYAQDVEMTPEARVRFDGAAGQSFGAFLAAGVSMELVGEANDYVGKGMGGGLIVIHPPADDTTLRSGSGRGSSTVLAGNTCLYGATGGELFVGGAVGERFAVRNSGATVVVEGCGANGCEYMTGGVAVVLGEVGANFGAGMTGGMAFVYDPADRFAALNEGRLTEARPTQGLTGEEIGLMLGGAHGMEVAHHAH